MPFFPGARRALKGATSAISIARLSNLARAASLGNSITQYGGGLATSILTFNAVGALEMYVAQSGNFDIDIWGSDSNVNPGWNGANNGVAGQTLTTIGQRSPDANKLVPDMLFIQGGTNDNIGVGNYQATGDAYIAMAVSARAAGVKHVFIRSIWPKGVTQSTGTTVVDQRRYNAYLKAYCDANPTWCHYVNVFDLVTNPDGTPITGVLQVDDLHPTAYGGLLGAPAYKAAIEAVMDGSQAKNRMVDNFWATGNLLANGSFTGSTSATGTGMSGTMPTGWTPSGLTLTTVVSSIIDNADTGGKSWVLDITPPAGTGSETLILTAAAFTPTLNQWYKLWMEFDAAGNNLPTIQTPGNGVINVDNPITSVKTMGGVLPEGQASGKLRAQAPPIQMRAVSTALPINIIVPKGAAPYRVTLHRVYFGPQTDPHVNWGQTALPVNTVAPSLSGTPGVGNVITVNPGTWTGIPSATNVNGQIFKYQLYRDGIFVSNTYASGALAYTQVAADGASTLTWKVGASNQAAGRSAFLDVTGSVVVPDPTWKTAYDFKANTGKTNGVAEANSIAALTVTRATQGWDMAMTTRFAINTARRTSAGLVFEPAATDYKNFPTLPDNTNWTKSSATVSEGVGDTSPDGLNATSRIAISVAGGFIRRTIASSNNYRSAAAILKGTLGQQVDLTYSPGNVATPNVTTRLTFTGGWDRVDVPNILAGNSNMVVTITAVGGAVTFDAAYAGVGIISTGSATADIQAPFPLTTAIGSSGVESISAGTQPAGAGVFTFVDGTKTQVAVSAGTYNFPTNLGKKQISSFKIL